MESSGYERQWSVRRQFLTVQLTVSRAKSYASADHYVAFGEKYKMFIVGHCLVWHSQTPRWVFEDDQGKPLSREVLLDRMRDHIRTVVDRYKGRIGGWDVVNER